MKFLEQFLVPYLLAQAVALLFVVVALRNTRWARILFALLFAWAATTNGYLGCTHPEVYLDYAPLALPFYRPLILGPFAASKEILVPLIALGQAGIAVGMLLRGAWVQVACIAAVVFLLSITPLMVGSGFPFPLLVAWASWRIWRRDARRFIWEDPAGENSLRPQSMH